MRLISFLCSILFVTSVTATPALAEVPPLAQARTSKLLYDLGLERRDPVLVLAAASLRRSIVLEQIQRVPTEGEAGGALLTWEVMMDAARDLASADPAMLGVIEDVAAATTKGVTSGPVYNIGKIGPKKNDLYKRVPFDGRAYAEVYVEGKGPENLDLYVRDAKGRLVCTDTDASAIAYCGWTPRATGEFSIDVVNTSGTTSSYTLITN